MQIYSQDDIKQVAKALKEHKIIAFPTDTVYGVSVLYGDISDLEALKHTKNRPETKPIPMMVSDLEQMKQIAVVDARTEAIVNTFLPGPLTLVLPVSREVNKVYTNGMDTVAVRIPDAPFVLTLIDELKTPLLVTSANQSGQKTALTYQDVLEQLPNIDGLVKGNCHQLQASTIVDCTHESLKILREGPVSLEQLESAIQ